MIFLLVLLGREERGKAFSFIYFLFIIAFESEWELSIYTLQIVYSRDLSALCAFLSSFAPSYALSEDLSSKYERKSRRVLYHHATLLCANK